jgi:putative ABC transport system permease protein
VYVLWRDLPTGVSYLAVRTAGDPEAMISTVTRAIRAVDAAVPIADVRSLEAEMNLAIAGRELRLALVASFAVLAFGVALVGLVAVLGRSVSERRRELAIRAALGATPGMAVGLIVWNGTTLVVAGVVLGELGTAAAGRELASLVYGVSPYDPVTYVGVAIVVTVLAVLACYLPARRAARIDPLELLRAE